DAERIFSVIHLDGKSKNYYIKRFKFEDLAIGKRMSFINEEAGSKLIIITKAPNPIVKIEALKGKSQIFDESEVDISELIDVKGIKAQGNKLSPHDVKNITLLTDEDEDSEEEIIDSESEPEFEEEVEENQDNPEISSAKEEDPEVGEIEQAPKEN